MQPNSYQISTMNTNIPSKSFLKIDYSQSKSLDRTCENTSPNPATSSHFSILMIQPFITLSFHSRTTITTSSTHHTKLLNHTAQLLPFKRHIIRAGESHVSRDKSEAIYKHTRSCNMSNPHPSRKVIHQRSRSRNLCSPRCSSGRTDFQCQGTTFEYRR